MSQKALDRYGSLAPNYQAWQTALRDLYAMYAQDYQSVYPDGKAASAGLKVPDLVRLAAEDRARSVAAARPSLICRPAKDDDKGRAEAEKRERIRSFYWETNRVMRVIPNWAFDSMFGGLTVCRVLPDFKKSARERFPIYRRVEPLFSYPDPVYTTGPYLDSFVEAYEENVRSIEARFGVRLDVPAQQDKNVRAKVIGYLDGEQIVYVAEHADKNNYARRAHTVLLSMRHKLECCPVVIGTRPTADGAYRGEFDNAVDLVQFANEFATLFQDAMIRGIYPERKVRGNVDVSEGGPDGVITLDTPQDDYELVQHPGIPFTTFQGFQDIMGNIRTAVIMPPAREGNPNQSIISAAGITAAAGQYLEAVASTQRDVLKPMLEAADTIALKTDVEYSGNVSKTFYYSEGKRGVRKGETYNPQRDIGDYTHAEVVYTALSAVDDINRSVMVMQQHGNGLLSRRTALEQSTFVDDPGAEEKQMLKEQLLEAMKAGLLREAAEGRIDSLTLANIDRTLDDPEKSLSDAIAENTPVAPLAQPVGATPIPAASGVGGAQSPAETQAPLPDLASLGL